MTTTTHSLGQDHYTWLIQRIEELRSVAPYATVADGFEYALGCIDTKGDFTRETQNMSEEPDGKLNKQTIYGVQTADEVFWRFRYKANYGYGETTWAWEAEAKYPGKKFFMSEGDRTEDQIIEILEQNNHKLDTDDLIDLELWLSSEEFTNWINIDPTKWQESPEEPKDS
jgi:hypothetical protein